MKRAWIVGSAAAVAAVAVCAGVGVGLTSCTQQTTNVPVRTFERAQRVDVVCLKVLNDQLAGMPPMPPMPVPQETCSRVPGGVDPGTMPYHLFALVTQTARGEIAVVDLTGGGVVDLDHSTPGINFLPVGALPTDVSVAPDGKVAFVGAAEVNKPAIYAIDSRNILGDAQQLPKAITPAPPTLPSLPVCALPQAPSAVSIVPHGDSYELAVVLPGDGRSSAKVVTMDPAPFLRGAKIEVDAGIVEDAGPDADGGAGLSYLPGALQPCAFTGQVELAAALPSEPPSSTWPDGVPYADASPEPPPIAPGCTAPPGDAGAGAGTDAGPVSDAGPGADGGDGGAVPEAGVSDAAEGADAGDAGALDFGPGLRPHATSAARDGTMLYVGDDGVPLVHVIDVSTPGRPTERAPLVATSILEPSRRVAISDVAVSPATSDYRRYLYALDAKEGSIVVYDVTDPPTSPRAPLTRPHPEVNPFAPPDRITFSSPVATLSFVRHDFPVTQVCDATGAALANNRGGARSGLLCNPNKNAGLTAGPPTSDSGFGMCYRANATNPPVPNVGLGPQRLRGVFGFATLANGQIVAIDVDDWDAPCRRPDPMATEVNDPAAPKDAPPIPWTPSGIAPQEPDPGGPGDIDPYHVPTAFKDVGSPVSLESFFPVSAPHRMRSLYLLRNDPSLGIHVPYLNGIPQLSRGGVALPTSGEGGAVNPILLPAWTNLADPTIVKNPSEPDPGSRQYDTTEVKPMPGGSAQAAVRLSWEDPTVHLDQDWTVSYEGALPSFDGTSLATPVATTDGYHTLTLANSSALFCRKGIEDHRIGQQRASVIAAEMVAQKITPPPGLDQRLGDYIQLTDEILDVSDPYWNAQNNECWGSPDNQSSLANASAQVRHDACTTRFGAAADQSVYRDFPILEAYDDHLVVGRFYYPDTPEVPATRIVVGPDPGSVEELQRMKCCFHHQVQFRVRTGGLWVAVGSGNGYLHRVTTDASSGACVQSCEPREALLNARAPAVPWPAAFLAAQAKTPPEPVPTGVTPPGRNSALAVRNPAFSFIVWNGAASGVDQVPLRDMQWKFTTRGQFTPLSVNIASTTSAVAPQSMLFIDALNQLAVVDGSSQGLILIDMDSVALAHTPFF